MKKVFKFVKGKKDERKESGGITPSQSGDLLSPAQTPEDERFLGLDNSSGYVVDFGGKDKTLTKLHKAAWQGNLEKLKSALKKVDVDAVDRHNRTALHFAVAQGHPNIVWFLLGNNAKTSICDDEGHTPLLKAIECGHKECMTLLLDRGADVNVSDYTGNTGLHVAVGQTSMDTVSVLLKRAADTDISNNAGDYPLHIATRLENKDLVDLLLEGGASVDVLDRENRTPLMLAAKTGNRLLAQLFVERGAHLGVVDSNGWTAQDYAMLGGHESVAASLKSFSKSSEKKFGKPKEERDSAPSDNSESWADSQTDASEKEPITEKLKKFFEKCSEEEAHTAEKEKNDDLPESPDAEVIPPYCQPPRSWEMIQAGMIDENKNGIEPKRRSITTLGTLHSRRESFTEATTTSPKLTLSLNRRKGAKGSNAFAKQRFSFNEEQSLKYWINEEKTIRKDMEKIEMKNTLAEPRTTQSASESDWDSISVDNSQGSKRSSRPEAGETNSIGSQKVSSKNSDSGTLGREGTLQGTDEIWVINPHLTPPLGGREGQRNSWDSEDAGSEQEGSFPPPPTALELGVDLARSIRHMKGMSVDRPPGGGTDRSLWKNVYESHSLDRLEEKGFAEAPRENETKVHGKHNFPPSQRGEDFLKCQKPGDRFMDVNRRINEQLECYDQALRELAETCRTCQKFPAQNYHSLPFTKAGGGCACRRASCQELVTHATSQTLESGPRSLPLCGQQWAVENNESLGSEEPADKPPEEDTEGKPAQKLEKKTKRHMLLAMRDVKHAVHVANTFKTSMDDQILSPLAKPELDFDLDGNSTPKGASSSSEGNSPPDENPFFGIGRQETVLERNEIGRKSSSSGTGEESTLWLQDEAQRKGQPCPDSDDEVSEIMADERTKHKRVSSFSPLGVIQREMEEESRGKKWDIDTLEGHAGERRPLSPSEEICGENEEQNEENLREPSPDISLSSGPIEPIGADKDSGSEPESSHNDASSTHNYALKSQHEWLKSHLKAATSEKNKLEELTAQLSEKAERLQYELADAKEAAKSRDEVIQLLQGQLARMEAAYTKSLEESVQSRLQLTSHEQEILHLKELCFRYEEEKETAGGVPAGDFYKEMQLRIKVLEEEKEKMREEIVQLEEEKSLLQKQLKDDKNEESEKFDQCQSWKERCGKLEEMAKIYDSKQAAYESYMKERDQEHLEQENQLKQQNFQLERKVMELNEENIELKAGIQRLRVELDEEKKRASAKDEKQEAISDLKKRNVEMEVRLKELEKEAEEKMVKKLKEKEEEVESLLKQFNRERNSLIASYEKVMEGLRTEGLPDMGDWKVGSQRLKQLVESLQDRVVQMQVSATVEDAHSSLKNELYRLKDEWNSVLKSITETHEDPRRLDSLAMENMKLNQEVNDLKTKLSKGERGGVGSSLELKAENSSVKSEILELKTQVNSIRMLLDDRFGPLDAGNQKNFERRMVQKSEGSRRRGVGKEDELAWSSLYGMKTSGRRGGRSTSMTDALLKDSDIGDHSDEGKNRKPSTENIFNRLNATKEEETEIGNKVQKLEFLDLKKEILSLQGKMTDEKNLRHALENQMIKMNMDMTEKDNLEKEVNSLKQKVDRDYVRRSEMELLEFQRELEARRESYLREQDTKDSDNDYKAKCEILAKEREKSKEIRLSFGRRAKSFDCAPPESTPQLKFHSCPRPLPELFMQPRFSALDPDLKSKLERELDKSIKKYSNETSLAPSISNVQREFVKKKYF